MKRYIAVIGLLAFCNIAQAVNWIHVASSEDGGDFSIDADTVKRDGKKVTAWVLTNYPNPIGPATNTALSSSNRIIFDCEDSTYTDKSSLFYKERNAKGEVVFSETEKQLIPRDAAPGSSMESVLTTVCKATQ